MATLKKKKALDFNIEIGLDEGKEWSAAKLAEVKKLIKKQSSARTPEQRLKNEMMEVQYRIKEYLADKTIDAGKLQSIEQFLQAYLKILNLSFKKFALSIDTTDGNLKKYLSGERTFNIDLAMKFGHFFHTPPDIWLNIQTKNGLIALNQEKTQISKYEKYDYEKFLFA